MSSIEQDSILSSNSSLPKEIKTEKPVQHEDRGYLTGFKLYAVLSAITMVTFLILLDTSIIVTAIPVITDHFHSLSDLGWYGSSYQIASPSQEESTASFERRYLPENHFFTALNCSIYSLVMIQWAFLFFFFVFELGSLLCGVATSSKMFIVARAIAGMGSSGLINGALTIISSIIPLQKSPAYIGVVLGFAQLGIAIGPLIGGAFTEYTTWRWCFYINLSVGAVVACLLLFTHIPEHTDKPSFRSMRKTLVSQLDLIGFVLFAPAAIMLLLALEYGQSTSSWGTPRVIGLFCGAAATFAIFMAWERRQREKAMIPLAMIAKRSVWSSCIVMLALFSALLSVSYYLPVYFQAVKNDTPVRSGVSMLPGILVQLVFAVICGFLRFQIIIGIGRGAAFQTPYVAVQNSLPPNQISVAMSILSFMQTLSGAVFLTFADVIFSTGLKSEIPKNAPSADVEAIIAAGATNFRTIVSSEDLPGVLEGYAKSIDHVFYLAAALGVVCTAFGFGMGWKDIRKKNTGQEKF
ncbi:hypothetical protein N7495_005820 [Penicillium taxi]|uniref:uncharacterized protein n=1 Tax=Penicillium taxi TaxID=168475 RepID=UPI002545B902|nr:uncharacterized protein N7495_005820 [Penicillium taxi]KAJ5894129.1 hypothetical protein N7495_005820 [Penicillium taxi]